MRTLSKVSADRLATCHPVLQQVVLAALQICELHVIVGHRGQADQDAAYASGASKLKWPNGKHNSLPSLAVDLAPDVIPDNGKADIDWKYVAHFYYLAGVMLAVAYDMGVKLRWGGDWDSDGNLKENTFQDLGHFEVVQ